MENFNLEDFIPSYPYLENGKEPTENNVYDTKYELTNFNKQEFSQKVILPTASLKKLKIVELKQENDNKISFLRLITE